MSFKDLAVIGAGVMGADVALALACFNLNIVLKDISPSALDSAIVNSGAARF